MLKVKDKRMDRAKTMDIRKRKMINTQRGREHASTSILICSLSLFQKRKMGPQHFLHYYTTTLHIPSIMWSGFSTYDQRNKSFFLILFIIIYSLFFYLRIYYSTKPFLSHHPCFAFYYQHGILSCKTYYLCLCYIFSTLNYCQSPL